MLAKLLAPKVDLASLILRWGLASLFIVHGYFKIVQDQPLLSELSASTETAVGWAELICGGALALGLFSRLASLALVVLQVGAIVLVTGKYALRGPVIYPAGADYTRVGPEFNLVVIALCVGVILLGSGVFSLDHLLGRLLRGKKVETANEPVAVAS
jgi:uncharacterized membrane protein YphA (DoxX/SURF4 family)